MVPQDLEEVYVLKIRIKYSKLGNLRFIGHLDVMRYFQKEIRRAGLDVSYSKGYSPHQIISFAAPLAMGITSDGEYFDGEFESVTTSREMIDALNAVSVDEMKVTECVLLPDDAKNSMSVVSASDYVISFLDKAGTEERHNTGQCGILHVAGSDRHSEKDKEERTRGEYKTWYHDLRAEGRSDIYAAVNRK